MTEECALTITLWTICGVTNILLDRIFWAIVVFGGIKFGS